MSFVKKLVAAALAFALVASPALATLKTTIIVGVPFNLFSATTLGSARYDQDMAAFPPIVLTDGTGANQAQKVFASHRTLGASANESLDLAGTLTDPINQTVSFATVKVLYIKADPTNTNNVVVGNGTNPFVGPFDAGTDTLAVKPGGILMLVAPGTGWTVTGGTGDILKVTNSAGTTGVTYDLVLVGT